MADLKAAERALREALRENEQEHRRIATALAMLVPEVSTNGAEPKKSSKPRVRKRAAGTSSDWKPGREFLDRVLAIVREGEPNGVTRTDIVAQVDFSRTTVDRCLAVLRTAGMIRVARMEGSRQVYRGSVTDDWRPPAVSSPVPDGAS